MKYKYTSPLLILLLLGLSNPSMAQQKNQIDRPPIQVSNTSNLYSFGYIAIQKPMKNVVTPQGIQPSQSNPNQTTSSQTLFPNYASSPYQGYGSYTEQEQNGEN